MSIPLGRQILVASAPQLAALSAGGIVSFPTVLLQQLHVNDSTIQLDVHTASWIGSTHGLTGILACLVPSLMQRIGRKLMFIISCLIIIIGWFVVYFAQSVIALIVAEMIHGLSSNSLIIVSMLAVGEMIHPKLRIISMNMYVLSQTVGMNLMVVIGRYLTWKTAGFISCCPVTLALLVGLAWPESPEWLAYKGDFEKCAEAFKWLRGTDPDSQKELSILISAKKEEISQMNTINKSVVAITWLQIRKKMFYWPCMHTFVLLFSIYWSGLVFVLIYSIDLLQQVTGSESTASIGVIIIYSILLAGNILGTVVITYCNNKTVILSGGTFSVFFMFSACFVSFLNENNIVSKNSNLCMYCLIGFTISLSVGASTTACSVAAEITPVKHRGLGGAIYVFLICLFHFTSLKVSPYLLLYCKASGTFLLFGLNGMFSMIFIWIYIPETRNRSLQEIEDFYNYGYFFKRNDNNDIQESMNISNRDD